jgi:nucleoside-diphosphate-sugar epimerase
VRVLVTGASGFIGSRVAERLRADGHEVVPFSRRTGGDISTAARSSSRP